MSKSEKRKLINIGNYGAGLVFGILAIIQLIVATFLNQQDLARFALVVKPTFLDFHESIYSPPNRQFFANSLLPAFFLALFQIKISPSQI
ncbi:hypothetical protein KOY48_05445 [Candidatus Minimicrobia naudis]|uniref:Uncharacterized protein n=1 Tax=Candidatus Minimicrobia naudis TaxID=2841263 RepID=A0A8F1MBW7_9BACT|nr:hypothetical protein KOY48_05445 [Candidatus Minimicrobia naudis]